MGDKPGRSLATAGFRRRVIVELSIDELPLLDAATRRHGTIRQAVIEALRAADQVEELNARVAKAEAVAVQGDRVGRGSGAKAEASLERERKTVVKLERELARAQKASAAHDGDAAELAGRVEGLEGELERMEDAVGDRDADLLLLRGRVVDSLYCGRCDQWAPFGQWAWRKADEGRLAYHKGCGDHGPGLLGGASWLAYRSD